MVGEDEKAESQAQMDQENSADDKPHYRPRRGESSTSAALGSDMGDSLLTITPGGSRMEENTVTIFGEAENGTRELKIASPPLASLTHTHSNELGDSNAVERKLEVDTGRQVS